MQTTGTNTPKDNPAIVPQIVLQPVKAQTMSKGAFIMFILLAIFGVVGVVLLIFFALRYIHSA